MNPHQPYGHGPVPPLPAYAVPPPRKRGKGCLYAFIGAAAGLFMMVSCVAVVASSSDTPGSSDTPAPSESESPAAEKKPVEKGEKKATGEKKVTNGIGREYRDGKFAFTVTKVKKGVKKVGDQYFGDTAQGQFVFIYVTVKNIGDRSRTFTDVNQTLIDSKGRKFEADPEASAWTSQESKSFFEQINPGNSVKGTLIYDVPRGTRLKAIELHDSMWSRGVTVPLGNR
ncbi:Mpr protein [Mycobacterium tuberculosis]|nr:Mpr protein [Mycobacterium tuberculosis]